MINKATRTPRESHGYHENSSVLKRFI